ncbi:hypothetical protein [Daejeonella lutea]|uniref:Uncharacterized protein n=1 Tax=Daejeonella lutea TaxID=572036 RepID=A0A1T5BQB4_9SPHI|nr:hypothetical protein [Daejeonella lutea]SKB49123.1 hypothetical protein SAMN05661099_1643 [Daejeonella lutea]
MEHPLRITHNNSDYVFKLIKDSPVTKETKEFRIRLGEEEILICKTPTGWAQKNSDAQHLKPDLLNAIGHSLSLRFRLS